jgi:5'(3')-deoxyribonucleotidase
LLVLFITGYDLETKELELVLDKYVALFYIDNYGLYYSELGDSNQLGVNLLDFNNKITSLENYPWVLSYNEYLLTLLEGNLSLINRNTDEIIKIMPFVDNIPVISTIHIFENKLVFAVETCIYVLDLITGDKKSYNAKQADETLKLFLERIEDFAFVDNKIFASYGCKNIIKLDLDSDNIHDCISFDSRDVTYSYLQTNGERLFVSVYQFNPATVKFTVTGYDEIFIPDEGNVLTRKEFGQ